MDKINVKNSQNNIIKVTSNNVQQSEKRAESYANSAIKSSQDCANYLAIIQRLLQECVAVKNEINVTYLSDLTDHIEDETNPHNVTAEQVGTYTRSEIDGFLNNIDITVGGISASDLYEKTEVDALLAGKSDIDHTHSQYLTAHQDISGKVDKVSGKGLSTNDYTTAEKQKLASLSNYDDTAIVQALGGKADANHTHSQYLTSHQDISGKADKEDTYTKDDVDWLIQNIGFVDAYTKTESDERYQPAGNYLTSHQDISGKVDKVTGKGLSTNDYTTAEKEKLASLSNYDDTAILSALDGKADTDHTHSQYLTSHQDISGKVDKVVGKGLSTNDYSTAEKEKLAGLSNYDDTAILSALDGKANSEHTHSQYLTSHQDISGKADVNHTHSEYLTEHQSLANYYTKAEVVSAIERCVAISYTMEESDERYQPAGDYLTSQDISGKVDKIEGKGLSTNDYTTAEKEKLAGLSNYDDTAILSALAGKADTEHTHSQYLTSHQDISGKVDKVTGKGLSSNDYTTAEKEKLASLSNYDDTEIVEALAGKANSNHTHNEYLTSHQDISGKADKTSVYTKTEIDTKIGDIETILRTINGGA